MPAADAVPQAIFVTAIDTHPHAPDPQVVLAGREADFAAGMAAIEQLAPGPVYLCRGRRLAHRRRARLARRGARIRRARTRPARPACTSTGCIRSTPDARVWHIGYQDVAAIGHLLTTGQLDVERVVSLAGPAVQRPRLLRTRLGASLAELTRGELAAGELRVISGSVLDGRAAGGDETAFLGRHHRQVSVLHEGRERDLFGWITPQQRQVLALERRARPLRRPPRAAADHQHQRRRARDGADRRLRARDADGPDGRPSCCAR